MEMFEVGLFRSIEMTCIQMSFGIVYRSPTAKASSSQPVFYLVSLTSSPNNTKWLVAGLTIRSIRV